MEGKALNYNSREKQWKIYYRFEQKNKEFFLKKISMSDGFKILKELHQFVYSLKGKTSLEKLSIAKIKTLAKIHSVFGKVKQ